MLSNKKVIFSVILVIFFVSVGSGLILHDGGIISAIRQEVSVWRYCNMKYKHTTPDAVGSGRGVLRINLGDPMGIAVDENENIFVSDRAGFIWRLSEKGQGIVVAGTGRKGVPPDRGEALAVDLGMPEGLDIDSQGRLYLADSCNHIVIRIDTDGTLTRVAGDGEAGSDGDGGLATAASLNRPFDVRVDRDGTLFIADFGNHRIRKVTPNGIISTFAGTGTPGYSGDWGPAQQAALHGPYGVFPDDQGQVWIADSLNHVIRMVEQNGLIKTIAGRGAPGYSGDGGSAQMAELDTPQSLFVDTQGKIYINDEHNHVIRVIELDGTIRTVIGTGEAGFNGDGHLATETLLNDPENVIVRSDGSILVTDGDNGLVRKVGVDGLVQTFAGTQDKIN